MKMFDVYSDLKGNLDHPCKIEVDDLLFVEFKCFSDNEKYATWSANNFFIFVTNGKKIFKSINNTYELSRGDILFVKKGANLTYHSVDDQFCAILIFIPDDFIREVIAKFSLQYTTSTRNLSVQDSIFRVTRDRILENYYASIEAYLSLPERPHKQLLKLKIEELLLSLFSDRAHQELTDYFISLNHGREYLVRSVMEENYAYNLELHDFAQLCNMSESTFRRLFVQLYKTTPARWIHNRKLDLSRSKLVNSDLSIEQIAFESGFDDPSYFTKIFKKRYGCTPSQYRQSLCGSVVVAEPVNLNSDLVRT